jgi:sugar lactone lactonase YvrE
MAPKVLCSEAMRKATTTGLFLIVLLTGCGGEQPSTQDAPPGTLELVAESPRQWTGVAATKDGRLFVNFPRWSEDVPISVAELKDGKTVPFPDAEWNAWEGDKGHDPVQHFICVQSVTVDDKGDLWILDPANPGFQGVVANGAKLIRRSLKGGDMRLYKFDANVAPANSYLNDVRVDTMAGVAYITDSGAGALVVLDTNSGRSRRVLADHLSTKAEAIDITIEGTAWKRDGKTPQVHADGIALSPDRTWLYYQALTGRTMYRVPTAALRDESLGDEGLGRLVEKVTESGVSDGLIFDTSGNLYLSSLEENAINRLVPQTHARAQVVKDERLSWPDSFALGPDGWIYVTTAQIHQGTTPRAPYRLWRFKP